MAGFPPEREKIQAISRNKSPKLYFPSAISYNFDMTLLENISPSILAVREEDRTLEKIGVCDPYCIS